MIYIIGDSHVSGLSKDFYTLAIGGATAYGLLNEDSYSQSKKKIEEFIQIIGMKSWIVINFGEIDCRHHINRFTDKLRATENAVERYFKFIDTLKDYQIVIWCPIPNNKGEPTEKQLKKHGKYPMTGNYDDRLWATRCFNSLVRIEALSRNIPIIDIFDRIAGRQEFYKDLVHLNKEGYEIIKREIVKVCI